MSIRKTEKDYHDMGKRKKFKWLGETLPKNVSYLTDWKCSKGHTWKANYNNLQQGSGCPGCYKESGVRWGRAVLK